MFVLCVGELYVYVAVHVHFVVMVGFVDGCCVCCYGVYVRVLLCSCGSWGVCRLLCVLLCELRVFIFSVDDMFPFMIVCSCYGSFRCALCV